MRPAPTPSVKFTYEDFVSFPNDGKRHEIIDGEHFVTAGRGTKHQTVLMHLAVAIGNCLKGRAIGEVFMGPLDVVLSNFDVVAPDLLYISCERAGILTDENLRGAPDLVAEIVSPDTRKTDEVTKRKLYERFGVQEYWVVDPELDAIKVYRRVEGSFVRAAELTAETGDTLTTPLLPGFAVSLADVFASPV